MKKPDEVVSPLPCELQEIARRDSVGVQTPVSFNSPAEIGTAPRPQAVSFRKPPRDPDHYCWPGLGDLPGFGAGAGLAK